MSHPIRMDCEQVRQAVLALIKGLVVGEGRVWEVTVRRAAKKRTLSQNALLHKWFTVIAQSTGNSQHDVKEAYREMFLPKRAVNLGDRERMIGQSTTQLSTQEMGDFMDQIYVHASQELGIMLPVPEELHYDKDGHATVSEAR